MFFMQGNSFCIHSLRQFDFSRNLSITFRVGGVGPVVGKEIQFSTRDVVVLVGGDKYLVFVSTFFFFTFLFFLYFFFFFFTSGVSISPFHRSFQIISIDENFNQMETMCVKTQHKTIIIAMNGWQIPKRTFCMRAECLFVFIRIGHFTSLSPVASCVVLT